MMAEQKQQFYTRIHHNPTWCFVDIAAEPLERLRGTITARKMLDDSFEKVKPAEIYFNVNFGACKPDRINQIIAWIEAARNIAEQLDDATRSREDFRKRFEVRMIGGELSLILLAKGEGESSAN